MDLEGQLLFPLPLGLRLKIVQIRSFFSGETRSQPFPGKAKMADVDLNFGVSFIISPTFSHGFSLHFGVEIGGYHQETRKHPDGWWFSYGFFQKITPIFGGKWSNLNRWVENHHLEKQWWSAVFWVLLFYQTRACFLPDDTTRKERILFQLPFLGCLYLSFFTATFIFYISFKQNSPGKGEKLKGSLLT